MLVTPGDLIPVQPEATAIPWTRRKSQILNFLHRGPVDFGTLVYDTNVGDISPLSIYFNPDRISVQDLNSRFGQTSERAREEPARAGSEAVVKPRLLLYPEHSLNQNQVKVQRTLKWVLSQEEAEERTREAAAKRHPSGPPAREAGFGVGAVGSRAPSSGGGSRHSSGGMGAPGSRPGSAFGFASRLTPIGQPLENSGSSIGQSFETLSVIGESLDSVEVMPHTMPNLGSALDRVWSDGESLGYSAPALPTSTPAWSGWDPDSLWRPTGWSNSPMC